MSESNLMYSAFKRGWCDGKAARTMAAPYERPALVAEYERGYAKGRQVEPLEPSAEKPHRRWPPNEEPAIQFRKSAPAHKGYAIRGLRRAASWVALVDGQEVGEIRGQLGGGYKIFIAGTHVNWADSLRIAKLEVTLRLRAKE